MKVVIDIDENLYTRLYDNGDFDAVDMLNACAVIRKGTPLPKGHGRIADMDAAIKCIEEVEGEDAIWAINLIEWACSKRTIIEADKVEGSE